MASVKGFVSGANEVRQNYGAHNIGVLAGGVAFFALLSLFPTVTLVVGVLAKVIVEDPEVTTTSSVNRILNALPNRDPAVQQQVRELLTPTIRGAISPANGVLGVGGLVLAYTVSRVFGGLQVAMNVVFGVTEGRNFIMGKVVPFLAVFAMLIAVFAAIAASTVLGIIQRSSQNYFDWLPGQELLFRFVNIGVTLAILAVVFALMYRYLPATHVGWREVFLGGFVAAVLWSIVKEVASLAPRLVGLDATYGSISALLIFVTWIYLTIQIILLGGEVAAELARRRGSQSVRPRAQEEGLAPGEAVATTSTKIPKPNTKAVAGAVAETGPGRPVEPTDWNRSYAPKTPVGARNLLVVAGAALAALISGRIFRGRAE